MRPPCREMTLRSFQACGGSRLWGLTPGTAPTRNPDGLDTRLRAEGDCPVGSGGGIRTLDLQVMSLTSCHCSTPRRVRVAASALLSKPISPILSRTAIYLGRQLALRLCAAYPGLREPPQRPSLGLAPGRGYPFHSGQHAVKPPRWPAVVSVALFRASRRTGVTRCPALWSGDFPHGVHTLRMLAARLSSLLNICQYSTATGSAQPRAWDDSQRLGWSSATNLPSQCGLLVCLHYGILGLP